MRWRLVAPIVENRKECPAAGTKVTGIFDVTLRVAIVYAKCGFSDGSFSCEAGLQGIEHGGYRVSAGGGVKLKHLSYN